MTVKLCAPAYYKNFKCIADRCVHSCCIGWEIDVDCHTAAKYASLTEGYGVEIAKSIEWSETPHFRLCENDRCPHLDERGLCRIITELGEDCLCHICREHPRFYNDTSYGREVGLGMACEEAARLILSSDGYDSIEAIGEADREEEEIWFDAIPHRRRIFSLLSSREIPYSERLSAICRAYGVSALDISDEVRRELFASLEYLDDGHRELFISAELDNNTSADMELSLERALAYFIYRHCTAAFDEEDFRAALGFSLLCERLICSLAVGGTDLFEAARIVSEELEYSEENTERIKDEFYYTEQRT